MSVPQLFTKPKRTWRLKQPRKDAVRLRAELAEARHAYDTTPRLWRLWHRGYARLVETDPETAAAMRAAEELNV